MVSDSAALMVRKLNTIAPLSAEEQEAVRSLPLQPRKFRKEQAIVREGDRPDRCFAITDGLVARAKMSGTGKRQIVSINVPGDIPDLDGFSLEVMDHSIVSLTDVTLLAFPHADLRELIRRHPPLGVAFWRETVVDAAVTRTWLFNQGRQLSHVHMAHLLCEMFTKLRAVGLEDDRSFQFPVTQEQVADALGLSAVHVNRSLQALRHADLLSWESGRVTIRDWDGLVALAEFDPGYLHLTGGTTRH